MSEWRTSYELLVSLGLSMLVTYAMPSVKVEQLSGAPILARSFMAGLEASVVNTFLFEYVL